MMIGKCKKGWWWKRYNHSVDVTENTGKCYYQFSITKETSYCPDFYNRKKGNKEGETLEDWIKNHNEEINLED